jgi:hypothetical protein
VPKAIAINLDDEVQVDALFEACSKINQAAAQGHPLSAAEIDALRLEVNATRGDRVGSLERRADQREHARFGDDGWNQQ